MVLLMHLTSEFQHTASKQHNMRKGKKGSSKRQFHSDGMWPVSCILQDCGLFIHIQHNCSSPLGAVKLAGTLYTHTQLKQIALTDKLCFCQKNPLAHSAWIIHKLASHQR